MQANKKVVLFLFLILTLLLASCQTNNVDTGNTNTEEEQSQSASSEDESEVEAEEEAEEEEASQTTEKEVEDAGPQVGGTFIWAITQEPSTLDPAKASLAVEDTIMFFTGGSLVYVDDEGNYIPYLAESWTISEDGLVWEFILRQDVYFQDGSQLTAHDYAWTFNRAIDPDTNSPITGSMLGDVSSIEAADDFTLRITLNEPNYPLLYGLTDPGYMQPISQAIYEEMGEDAYSRSPVGVGPYLVKEWVTGDHILLQRNPDYNWGPESMENQSAYYIEYIEFRVIPEYATILAGMEAGEIDYASTTFTAQDIELLNGLGDFDIYQLSEPGLRPFVAMNLTAEPFDDILVRQAINLAVDRQTMVDLAVNGNGEIQNGPLSSTVFGYWEGIEELGYEYDPELAKSYLEEAGYTLNEDGIYQKDDLVLSFTVKSSDEKVSQILKEQLKDVGIEITIESLELGTMLSSLISGDYSMAILGFSYGEADILYLAFHSSNIGALNISHLASEELDAILEATRKETDDDARQEACNEAQKYIVEQAYVVPLYAAISDYPISQRFENVNFSEFLGTIQLDSAYMEN